MVKDKSVKYLVYVDILGFDKLAKDVEDNENIKTNIVRENIFKNPINEEIKKLKEYGKISGVSKGRDDWILVINDFDDIFEVVSKISRIEMPVDRYAKRVSRNYGSIPLEIAVGIYGFDKWAKLDGEEVICNDEVIDFLKTYILPIYCKTYKNANSFEIKNWDLSEEHLKEEFLNRGISLSECLLREENEGKERTLVDALNRYEIKKDENSFKVSKLITKSFVICTDSFFDELKKERVEKYFVKKDFTYTDKTGEERRYYLLNKEKVLKKGKSLIFLQKISLEEKRYRRIEDLYVPPKNFNEISEKLKNEKIIFLIGDAEMGKTYTSVKLLLDSYNEGYTPVYYREREPEKQFEAMCDKLDRVIQDGAAIYFEDPWGKTEFKSPEHIFRDIGDLISKVSEVNTRVIITSREKIFKKFEERKETTEDLWQRAVKLKVGIDYSKENLKEILEKYLLVFEPEWCRDEKLKQLVIGAIENEVLNTPMSIKKLLYSRKAKNSDDEHILKRAIKRAAAETKIAFGKEIIAMFEAREYEKIVFLSFPYISEDFELNFIEKKYNDFLKFLNKEHGFDLINAKSFDYILDWFEMEEVESYSFWFEDKNRLKFSHPAYSDGFSYALNNKELYRIFYNLMVKLSGKNPEVVGRIVELITNNFDTNNFDLTKLSKDENVRMRINVVYAITWNFDKFPELAKKLLRKLSKDENTVVKSVVVRTITNNFDKFPELAKELLTGLSENKDVSIRKIVAWAIADNFNKLPSEIQNLLSNLQQEIELIIEVKSDSHNKLNKLKAVDLISNIRLKLRKEFAVKILTKLSKDKDKSVRQKALSTLKQFQ